MSHVLDENERNEAEKILKYLKSMDLVLRTSPNPEQKERVKKDMTRYWTRLRVILPYVNFSDQNPDKIISQLATDFPEAEQEPSLKRKTKDILNHIPLQKISPSCNDHEINLLHSMISLIEKEYWPSIYEKHCKLDFSHGAARGRLKINFENILRSFHVLAQIIEDHSSQGQKNIHNQSLKTRDRYMRSLIIQVNDYMHELTSFLRNLLELADENRLALQNADNIIRFNEKFEQASMLEGVTVENALRQFLEFGTFVLNHTKLPELRKNKKSF